MRKFPDLSLLDLKFHKGAHGSNEIDQEATCDAIVMMTQNARAAGPCEIRGLTKSEVTMAGESRYVDVTIRIGLKP